MDYTIIAVDDELSFLESIRRSLVVAGFKKILLEQDPKNVADLFQESEYQEIDIALIDVTMPGINGEKLLEIIKQASPATECIMVTGLNDATLAIRCLRKGAYDYLVKPLSPDDLVFAINRALEKKRLMDLLKVSHEKNAVQLKNPEAFKDIISQSPEVQKVLREAELHATSLVPVLITGESGTGKELLAQAVHAASSRAAETFTPVNMASLSGELFDAEFFGHTKGAFTGANQDRKGYLEYTNKGTLFMDEIGGIPLEFQGKLLRVLQEREYLKLGTSLPRTTDIRFIAATNSDLELLMQENRFRKDFYYRLQGTRLHLPPLRERKADIPLLVRKFLKTATNKTGQQTEIAPEALAMLMGYDFPGNIRELKSLIMAAINLAQDGPITPACLPRHLQNKKNPLPRSTPEDDSDILPLSEIEKAHIIKAYQKSDSNKTLAARMLGIGLNTLRRKLESYGME